jgi:hypothetical protein
VLAVDFARIFYYSQIIEQCARNGAIYASDPVAAAQSPYTSLHDAALADASNITPQPTVTSTNGTDASKNHYVQVTVSWAFKTITSDLGVMNSVDITRTVQMRMAP